MDKPGDREPLVYPRDRELVAVDPGANHAARLQPLQLLKGPDGLNADQDLWRCRSSGDQDELRAELPCWHAEDLLVVVAAPMPMSPR
jgi:hypothetical protein